MSGEQFALLAAVLLVKISRIFRAASRTEKDSIQPEDPLALAQDNRGINTQVQVSRTELDWLVGMSRRRFRGPIPHLPARFLLVHRSDSQTQCDSHQDQQAVQPINRFPQRVGSASESPAI
jgi:hypothetical protein